MQVIAHRGNKKYYPENTMVAFKSAANYPINGIECDIQLTRDRVPVIIHDPTLERTTNGVGRVADMSYKDISELDAGAPFSNEFSGEKIPSLEEFCAFINQTNLTFHLELKEQLESEGFVKRVLEIVKQAGMIDKTVVSTFIHPYLKEVKEFDSKIETALLTRVPLVNASRYMKRVQADSIHIRHGVQTLLHYRIWARQQKTIRAYNVHTAIDYKRCEARCVSGIISDDPRLMTSFKS
ncbi:glycerophosphodiester phosphodiesterase [Paenalkalicoccus suaedae]|uniref:Glycerophosphodiester phosphodiesterase n=1 Tax=Paenalkalicoccus suaedae TaxID=2592382 RepID=A0A859FF81_9BACI|nr:glycerophosphodiester phosphodiesterase family protein [Paenalkalicoccus suaedae]QKS70875.1 glycerophosphodiester phosphodiesterase [Paenalkalicoccus suaedae]